MQIGAYFCGAGNNWYRNVLERVKAVEAIIVVALIIINFFTVYKFIFNVIFSNREDFYDSVRYSFTPNIISLFRGEYWKDRVGEFKLGIFIFLCIAVTGLEYMVVNGILRWILNMWKWRKRCFKKIKPPIDRWFYCMTTFAQLLSTSLALQSPTATGLFRLNYIYSPNLIYRKCSPYFQTM